MNPIPRKTLSRNNFRVPGPSQRNNESYSDLSKNLTEYRWDIACNCGNILLLRHLSDNDLLQEPPESELTVGETSAAFTFIRWIGSVTFVNWTFDGSRWIMIFLTCGHVIHSTDLSLVLVCSSGARSLVVSTALYSHFWCSFCAIGFHNFRFKSKVISNFPENS